MKYFYWWCEKCDRRFKSIFAGGRQDIKCVCGCDFQPIEITKRDYDGWIKENVKKCKVT